MEIFSDFFDPGNAFENLSRAGHILAGITWIGLLYFFNFVQVPAYAQLSDSARSEALRNVSWRALWWFRWAAMATVLFGIALALLLQSQSSDSDPTYFESARGYAITAGIIFGLTMFANVWLVIWPAQQKVIGSARTVAEGGQADPDAPAAAKKGARASRANTFMSFTMLWFMVYAPHMAITQTIDNKGIFLLFVLVVWAFIEGSALGLIGGLDSPFNKLAFDQHRNTIIYGFVTLAIVYFIGWELLAGVDSPG